MFNGTFLVRFRDETYKFVGCTYPVLAALFSELSGNREAYCQDGAALVVKINVN
jgi:hypothetical protein